MTLWDVIFYGLMAVGELYLVYWLITRAINWFERKKRG